MIANLVLLSGEDDYRLGERKKYYRDAFQKKYPEGEVETFDENSSFANLENSVFTPNLFGGRRLVFLENFWDPEKFEKAEKSDFFKHLPEQESLCTLIVIEPKLDKRMKWSKFLLGESRNEEFSPMDRVQILRWVQTIAEKKGGKLSNSSAEALLNRCGDNLWQLSQEIEKLVLCSEGEITERLIAEFTLPNPQAVIWDFLESVSKRSVVLAMARFRDLISSGISVHEVLSMLEREVRIHAQIRSALDQGMDIKQMASETGIHPFVLSKTLPLTRQFSMKKIEQLYDQLFAIEQNLKTGKIFTSTDDTSELELAIEKFIMEACK